MQWLVDNWLLVLLGGGMFAMHLFGHGGHGGSKTKGNEGHGGHGGGCCGGSSHKTTDTKADQPVPDAHPRHKESADV